MVVVDPQFDQLVQKIAPQTRLLRVWPLAGGIAAQMVTFEIENADGYVQKLTIFPHNYHYFINQTFEKLACGNVTGS